MCAPTYKEADRDSGVDVASARQRGLLHEDIVDAFARGGVSCDALDAWATTAMRALPHSSVARSETLPVQGRDVVVRFLSHLVGIAGLEKSDWFDAVLLFDAYRYSVCVSLEMLPSACAAVVSLLVKQTTAASGVKLATLAFEASHLALWLQSVGIPSVAEVQISDVRAQEHAIIAALNWRLNLTPVNAWLGAFRKRFCIVTSGRVSEAIDWVIEKSTFSAGAFLHSTSSCASLSPQEMANGLFCLGLVEARLLPLDAMRTDEFSPTDWEGIFASNTELRSAAEQCALPPQHLSHMLDTLEVATSCTVSRLKRDTYAVALAMGHAVVKKN